MRRPGTTFGRSRERRSKNIFPSSPPQVPKASHAQRVRVLRKRGDQERDVLVEVDPELACPLIDLLAIDLGGKASVLELLAHREDVHFPDRLARTHRDDGADEARQLVARE